MAVRRLALCVLAVLVLLLGCYINHQIYKKAQNGIGLAHNRRAMRALAFPALWILPSVPSLWIGYQQLIANHWEECEYGLPWEFHVAALLLVQLATPEVGNLACTAIARKKNVPYLDYYWRAEGFFKYWYTETLYWSSVRYFDGICVAISFQCSSPHLWQGLLLGCFISSMMLYAASCICCCSGCGCHEDVAMQALFGRSPTAMIAEIQAGNSNGGRVRHLVCPWIVRVMIEVLQICARFGLAASLESEWWHQSLVYLFSIVSVVMNFVVAHHLMVHSLPELADEASYATMQLLPRSEASYATSASWICEPGLECACFVEPAYFKAPDHTFISVSELDRHQTLVDMDGRNIEVQDIQHMEPQKRDLVEIHFDNQFLTFTDDHRMAVLRAGTKEAFPAKHVKTGDKLLMSSGEEPVNKVKFSQENISVYKVTFFPDNPVEVFKEPPSTITTYGAKRCRFGRSGHATWGRLNAMPAEEEDLRTFDSFM